MQEVNYFQSLPDLLQAIKPIPGKYLLLTDQNLEKIYFSDFASYFSQQGQIFQIYALSPGEESKCQATMDKVLQFMFEKGFDRQDKIIAFGGGVITDFGGFLASIYMRGIEFLSIPTSLLAMVDAAIGGKTGINTNFGKNLLGSFYFPINTLILPDFLKTLSNEHFNNGMAEVIKCAIIDDASFFKQLMKDELSLLEIIQKTVNIKLNIIEKDPKEKNIRKYLNFGHTIGHGIEFSNKILHGFAVALGIQYESLFSVQQNILSMQEYEQILKLLQKYNLLLDLVYNISDILGYIALDKKKIQKTIYVVAVSQIGKVQSMIPISKEAIKDLLSKQLQIKSLSSIQPQITIPGSKSITNRALILAALQQGTIELHNFLEADDTTICKQVLKDLGLLRETQENVFYSDGLQNIRKSTIFVGNSGTTARFILPLLLFSKETITVQCTLFLYFVDNFR